MGRRNPPTLKAVPGTEPPVSFFGSKNTASAGVPFAKCLCILLQSGSETKRETRIGDLELVLKHLVESDSNIFSAAPAGIAPRPCSPVSPFPGAHAPVRLIFSYLRAPEHARYAPVRSRSILKSIGFNRVHALCTKHPG